MKEGCKSALLYKEQKTSSVINNYWEKNMKQMQNLFVPFELAQPLKEKGFNESCFGYYNPENEYMHCTDIFGLRNAGLKNNGSVAAPLYQQAVDWLREEHNIHICITPPDGVFKYTYEIKYFGIRGKSGAPSYYEALTKAIEEAIKLI